MAKHALSGSRIKFFLELGFRVAELSDWAERSFNKLLNAGLSNEWPVFILRASVQSTPGRNRLPRLYL